MHHNILLLSNYFTVSLDNIVRDVNNNFYGCYGFTIYVSIHFEFE